jgi:uncharacterized protein YbbC (DUF1343 family)
MGLCMEAASDAGIPFIVCDRPNPVRGDIVQGPVLKMEFKSFVGLYPVPVRHGLTVGEIAIIARARGWVNAPNVQLHVVPMKRWRRDMWYDETGLPWIHPSPNLRDLEDLALYPGLCFLEGTNLSEGRGTDIPFKVAGAPFLHGDKLVSAIGESLGPFVRIEHATFTPKALPGATSPKFDGQRCEGIRIFVVDRDNINPIFIGFSIIAEAIKQAPALIQVNKYFTTLTGSRITKKDLSNPTAVMKFARQWAQDCEAFKEQRKPYLLYE